MAEPIAEMARRVRSRLALSQREFARLLGTATQTVSRWESGERDPGALGRALFSMIDHDPEWARRVLVAKRRREALDHVTRRRS